MTVPPGDGPLLAAVRDAVSRRTCVSVVGLPGSGRTTLLDQLRLGAQEDDWTVLSLPAFGRGGRPLEPLVLAGLFTAPAATTSATAAAAARVASAVGSGRALVLIDDAESVDDATAAVLAATVASHDVTVVAALRPPYPGLASVDRIMAGRNATVLWVPPLPFEVVHRLAHDVLGGDVDSDAVGRIYALSGGLPGIARAITLEARSAGRLVRQENLWVAQQDLWTAALSVVVDRLVAGLGDDETDAVWTLAALGPAEVATVRRLLPWSVIVALDDHGLLRFVEEADRTLVALFPPLVAEHLRHYEHTSRGMRAVEAISTVLTKTEEAQVPRLPLSSPVTWSSPESAAVLGRVLRERSATRLLVCRDAWEVNPSNRNIVMYLDALVTAGAAPETIETVLHKAHEETGEDARHLTFVWMWEAGYRSLILHDPVEGLAKLTDLADSDPADRPVYDAVAEHIRLAVGDSAADVARTSPRPGANGTAATAPRRHRTPLTAQADEVVRLVHGEALLARGAVNDAHSELAAVSLPESSPRQDARSMVTVSLLCVGDIESATERSSRLLDQALAMLEGDQIEPLGYVVALGLYLQGRLTSLREHLTSVFAMGSPAPLRPSTRAGLLSIGAVLSILEGNLPSARSMISQVTSLRMLAASSPFARPGPLTAMLEVASGQDVREATAPAWDGVQSLADQGHVLAAVVDGAHLAGLWADPQRAGQLTQLAELAATAQGAMLPCLGRYIRACAVQDPETLLDSVDDLSAHGLNAFAVRAHAAAVRLLRAEGLTTRARDEETTLARRLAVAGEELHLVTPASAPADTLTAREVEVARLIAAGLTNKEIAERLVVSSRTVDNHVYRIFRKLGVASRNEVAALL